MHIDEYEGFILDLDGTTYRGHKLIPGAKEVINHLISEGKKIVFISNKTTGTAYDYWSFLSKNGLNIDESQIITAGKIIKKFLMVEHFEQSFFAIGEKAFISELVNSGLVYQTNPKKIEVLIVTLDRFLNRGKLQIAEESLKRGAKFFAANIDDTCPVENGEITDAGSIISELERRTGRKLQKHFGKPSDEMKNEVLNFLKVDKSKCLIIGDRIQTDIAMGNQFNIDTALVSTGVKLPSLEIPIKPTYNFNSVADLLNLDSKT